MDFEWAYPIGHQDLTLDPSVIRSYYQPVVGRDNTRYTNGFELVVPPDNDKDKLYAMTKGVATFSYNIGYSGSTNVINRVSLAVDVDFALGLQTALLEPLLLGSILYDNVDYPSFLAGLDALIDARYQQTGKSQGYNILTTKSQGTTLLEKLGDTFGSPQYIQAKHDFVLAAGNGAPFNVMAGDNFGRAGNLLARGSGMPTNYKTIILCAKDYYGKYFNFALVVEALLRGSSSNNFVSLTDPRSGAIKYTTKFVEKLGITPPRAAAPTPQLPNPPAPAPPVQNEQPPTAPPPAPTPTNPTPPIPGTRDIVLDRELFEWHTGNNPNARVRWKYDANDDFCFKVEVIDRANNSIPYTLTKYRKGPDGKRVAYKEAVTFQVRDAQTPASSTKLDAYVDSDVQPGHLARQNMLVDLAIKFYNDNKDLVDNIGYYLGVPEELLLAIAAHESAGFTYPVRLEPIERGDKERGDKFLALAKKMGMDGFVSKYEKLAPIGSGASIRAPDLNVAANQALAIKHFPKTPALDMTWTEYFAALDRFALNSYITSRVSPGLAQTLISTADSALTNVQDFVRRQYPNNTATVLQRLGLANVPTTPSTMLLWLMNPVNSLVAGAAYMRQKSGSSRWDLPRVGSYYNDGGSKKAKYYGTKKPNPWGYLLNDEEYCLDVMAVYNVLRRSGIQFKAVLRQDVSTD